MKRLPVCFVILLLFACTSNHDPGTSFSDGLQGKWVEIGTRTDTLSFQSQGGTSLVTLGRGWEFRSGHWLPKPQSGPYNYKLEPGKISLRWLLSSVSGFQDYNFSQEENRFTVDNFYDSPSGPTLTFERLH